MKQVKRCTHTPKACGMRTKLENKSNAKTYGAMLPPSLDIRH